MEAQSHVCSFSSSSSSTFFISGISQLANGEGQEGINS